MFSKEWNNFFFKKIRDQVVLAINLYCSVKIASLNYSAVEQELFPLATQASEYMDRLFPAGKLAEVKDFCTTSVYRIDSLATYCESFTLTLFSPISHLHLEL